MELGVASSIAVKHICNDVVEKPVNKWLQENPNVEVIDIKFSVTATHDEWSSEALIIYRKEN